MECLVSDLGDEIDNVDQEVFELFSQVLPSRDLGMIDPSAQEVDITIHDKTFTIKQNSGILLSGRQGGTTGAAVWECSVRFAEWLASPTNLLFERGHLATRSVVLELGSGTSGLSPLALGPRCQAVIATDQPYILKLLEENIDTNSNDPQQRRTPRKRDKTGLPRSHIEVASLDWEADDVPSFLHARGLSAGLSAVIASDCIYNYALIEPFVDTCIQLCNARQSDRHSPEEQDKPILCIVAQQLRQSTVFEQWLQTFMEAFHVWRIPDRSLTDGLKQGSGFVVHVGILKQGR